MICAGPSLFQPAGAGKLDVGTIDPVYDIGGKKYSTYGFSTVGIHEAVTGVVSLHRVGKLYSHTIHFNKAEEGSDLWVFHNITDRDFNKLVVLLTPGSPGRVWYTKDPHLNSLTFYSDKPGEVSYQLCAPRFDHREWGNIHPDQKSLGLKVKHKPELP